MPLSIAAERLIALPSQELLHPLEVFQRERTESAFAALVREHESMVRATCARLLGANHPFLDDACQSVFLVLARKASGLRRQTLGGWLHKIARNIAADVLSEERRRSRRERNYRPPQPPEPAPQELLSMLDAVIGSLTGAQREVVVRHYLEGQSHAHIADALGIPEGAVKKRASDALSRFRHWFARRGLTVSLATLTAVLEAAAPSESSALNTSALLQTPVSPLQTRLVAGALKAMLIKKILVIVSSIASVTVLGGGILFAAQAGEAEKKGGDKNAAVAMPAWRKGLSRFTLNTIPFKGVFAGVYYDYSGGALWDYQGKVRMYFLAPGGHAICSVNQVDVYDFMQDAGVVRSIAREASSAEVQHEAEKTCPHHYSDGLPASCHNYGNTVCIERAGLAVRMTACTPTYFSGSRDFAHTDAFNVANPRWKTNEWVLPMGTAITPVGTIPGAGGQAESSTLKDWVTGDVHYRNGTQWGKYDGKTGEFTNLGPVDTNISGYGGCIDHARNRMVTWESTSPTPRFCVRSLSQPYAFSWIGSVVADAKAPTGLGMPLGGNSFGLTHDLDNDLYWIGGSTPGGLNVWTVDPTSLQATYRGTSPFDPGAGPYNRFEYSPTLHGIVYVSRTEVQFIPTK